MGVDATVLVGLAAVAFVAAYAILLVWMVLKRHTAAAEGKTSPNS